MDWTAFFGRFHVVLLHLPIGILTLAALAEIWGGWRRLEERPPFLNLVWLGGWISGVATCLLGWMLSLSGGYDEAAIDRHFLWGVIATAIGLLGWIFLRWVKGRVLRMGAGLIQIIALSLAGHLGGNLTHGPEYLFEHAPNPLRLLAGFEAREAPRPEIVFLDDADIFLDVVRPILKNRCTSCHNPAKTKGELLLDTHEGIMAGGKTGAAVVPGDLAASELIVRVHLDPDDKKFMPTDGKPPLTDDERAVLEWWIETGAPASGTVFDLSPTVDMRPRLAAAAGIVSQENELGLKRREALDPEIVAQLESLGFDVKPISQEIAYVDVDYFGLGDEGIPDEKLAALQQARDHVAWLNLGDCGLTDAQLGMIASLPNLLKLNVDRNPLSDAGVVHLKSLKRLEVLNLHGTRVSDAAYSTLDALPRLQKAYLWGTDIVPNSNAKRTYAVFGLTPEPPEDPPSS